MHVSSVPPSPADISCQSLPQRCIGRLSEIRTPDSEVKGYSECMMPSLF
jgi:hypothetical protein